MEFPYLLKKKQCYDIIDLAILFTLFEKFDPFTIEGFKIHLDFSMKSMNC